MESKHEKFHRLAPARVNKTLDEMRKIANLKSASYESSPDERRAIITALRKGIEELEYVFSGEKANKSSFTFGDPSEVEESSE